MGFKDAFSEHNRLDLLVNCAGIASGPDVIKVNLVSVHIYIERTNNGINEPFGIAVTVSVAACEFPSVTGTGDAAADEYRSDTFWLLVDGR